ncbi:protein [Lentinula edodes]|uniref:Protein n=1 Tax=Lentinula edodes TaxID=5353 RepID=A0A1Q3DUS2_LENED|nr:protein [Lentinula edodes]
MLVETLPPLAMHVQQKHNNGGETPDTTGIPPEVRDELDFSTVEGLADINNIIPDPQYRYAPSTMIKFARILGSVDRRNGLWNSDHAQAFLQMVIEGKALNRITDILQFENISSQSGMGFSTLSFQRGYFPILQFLVSDLILKSTLNHNLNALYTALDESFEFLCNVLHKCMNEMIGRRSWKDSTPGLPDDRQSQLTGIVVFSTLSTLLQQFFSRFKNAIHNHPRIVDLIRELRSWFDTWNKAISQRPPSFDDNLDEDLRQLTVDQIRDSIGRLQEIIKREQAAAQTRKKPAKSPIVVSEADRNQALLTRLKQSYDPPGHLRKDGPRHDNDGVEISTIQIIPTHAEMLCPVPPYVPVTLPDAPHHCRKDSMERLLDVQFRLLREELVAPVRESLSIIQDDLDTIASRRGSAKMLTQLEEVVARNGGMYRTKGHNSVMFQVYTNVELSPLKAERKGFTVGLVLDAPPGGARAAGAKDRQDYWKHAGSKRLASGTLVALLLVINNRLDIYLGTVASSNTELVDSSKYHESRVEIRVSFVEPQVELMALRRDKATVNASQFAILIDNSIMFESVRPFLDTLQSVEPTSIPFKSYLSQSGNLDKMQLHPPKFATSPRFMFHLDCLARPGKYIHPMKPTDEASIRRARFELKLSSILDASQADAMVDALTREVALIQGPPGTGKSFTGKEILRVLFKNKISPVVLIAFTNHALDHMLLSLLDADITSNFVRLGSRSSNERIAEYTLDKLEKTFSEKQALDRTVGREYASLKKLEEQMKTILDRIQIPEVTFDGITEHLRKSYPSQSEWIHGPPFWIAQLFESLHTPTHESGQWTQVSHKKRRSEDKQIAETIYGFWKLGQDLEFIRPPNLGPIHMSTTQPKVSGRHNKKKKKEVQTVVHTVSTDDALAIAEEYRSRMSTFFGKLGFGDQVPSVPESCRLISELVGIDNVWTMSFEERLMLASFWEDEMRRNAYETCLDEYKDARQDYEEACQRFNDVKDENRRRLLTSVDLIGCTTNGAAKLTSLLTTVAPKVLVVEEAGQVLEAHILASLVPSVQHLICIGDPQQLRPNITNYDLSMDSERGKTLFKFDRSLMERLSDTGLPMSQINVQRRMRPTISAHIRTILYPNLEDHLQVTRYAPVQGMQKDVFFLSHMNKENGGGEEASVSKSNSFEVTMIVELVMYFLKQECYNAPGDIAVLCAYLGQLQKVKAALKNLKVTVALDERDEEQLVRQGMEDENTIEQVSVTSHIRLGTVDIFQGEEAKIVIVSLVRNSGSFEGVGAPIGFLKSVNRINVALSRAQHGLMRLGVRLLMEWSKQGKSALVFQLCALDILNSKILSPHPSSSVVIRLKGDVFLTAAIEWTVGMSVLRCVIWIGTIIVVQNFCSDSCGECTFPMDNVELPCGHRVALITCFEYDNLKSVYCMTCGAICARLPCDLPCQNTLDCGHRCNSVCGEECSKQKCVKCIPEGERQDIVDFLMQRTLAEIDLDSDDFSERLITLDCGHIFTAETLDGHCHMKDFYEVDQLDQYLSMKAPPTKYQQPPTCPTCRSPITSRRYGRVTKRANLDILEQNVASNLAKALNDVSPTIQILRSRMDGLETSMKDMKYEPAGNVLPDVETIEARRGATLHSGSKENEILPAALLTKNAMTKDHGIPAGEAEAWFDSITTFHGVYKKVARVVNTQSAHVRAYEAALVTLYHLELSELASDPSIDTNSTNPQSLAFQNVNKKIGQPPHKADRRYQIEALLLSVELRFMLGSLARTRVDNLPLTSNDEEQRKLRRLWASFTDFLYQSCEEDCRKGISIAENSSSPRLAARSTALLMCSEFERVRFAIMQKRAEKAIGVPAENLGEWKDMLRQEIQTHTVTMRVFLEKAEIAYMRSRPAKTFQELREERAWFNEHCRIRMNRCLDEFKELEKHIIQDSVYQAVSMQEREEIVKSFGFTHRGHFYNCPNGHPFVITECGGAMEASVCPECGERIGGESHQIDASNTRAREFEEIAGNQGVGRSPWAWARDA